jgi:hypothetical protein
MGAKQTTMGKILAQLIDAAILRRDIPFGDTERNAKRTLYRVADPAIRFWYRVASPHRSRWRDYSYAEKVALIRDHAGTVFEDACRARHGGSQRYWEGNLELDCVWREGARGPIRVAECKLAALTAPDRTRVLHSLQERWERSKLASRIGEARFEVFDARSLREIAREE